MIAHAGMTALHALQKSYVKNAGRHKRHSKHDDCAKVAL